MDHGWRLGENLNSDDYLLAPITFDDLIQAVCQKQQTVSRKTVHTALVELLEHQKNVTLNLMEDNMDIILHLIADAQNARFRGKSNFLFGDKAAE